ncbi:hypothetical protein F5878DRAFT_645087 [Lentinula raphanica]|uniref:Uncharacterized protein n=1 Tax=Lentinula raphanica TaxID=153919 RepID=A0AA38P1K2_9AGAR|nr:hypothetical protein F5878DRAFT_645087 [Lentinula raphanica]
MTYLFLLSDKRFRSDSGWRLRRPARAPSKMVFFREWRNFENGCISPAPNRYNQALSSLIPEHPKTPPAQDYGLNGRTAPGGDDEEEEKDKSQNGEVKNKTHGAESEFGIRGGEKTLLKLAIENGMCTLRNGFDLTGKDEGIQAGCQVEKSPFRSETSSFPARATKKAGVLTISIESQTLIVAYGARDVYDGVLNALLEIP